MTTEQVMAFLLFAFVAAVTPGPSNIMLTAAGAHAGVRAGSALSVRCLHRYGPHDVPGSTRVGSLVLGHPLLLKALNWGGAAVLLWLSWKIATSGGRIEAAPGQDPVGYIGAAVFQWVNPKSWLVSASAAGTFLSSGAGSPIVQAASLGVLFVLAALPSGFVWLAFGASVQSVLHSTRRLRIFNIVMGLLLALSIVLIIA